MKFLEQLKVVSRRNKTIRKAFVSYRPDVRMIYYDATRENELRERIPVAHDNFLKSNRKTKLQRLKGLVHDNAHARRFSLQNKFVGSTLNSKSPLPVQSLKILRFIRTSVALAGLVILR